jgi:hypothetical protein
MANYKPWTDKGYLTENYVKKRKTCKVIADECTKSGYPVTEMTIYNWCKKFNLITNGRNLGSRTVGTKKKGGFYG